MSKKYPLEIILRHTGVAELVNADDETLWASDEDPDFKDTVSQEFLTEDDVDDILAYLEDANLITESEALRFESGEWDVSEESLSGDEDPDGPTAMDTDEIELDDDEDD